MAKNLYNYLSKYTGENVDFGVDVARNVTVFNITTFVPLEAGVYYTLATALAAVDERLRKVGFRLTFEESAGVWVEYMFVGSSVAEWADTTGWLQTDNNVREVTYSELVGLRDAVTLVEGQLYRITDYTCTTTTAVTQSAGHLFDIVVVALAGDTLSEIAYAIQHEGDTYFDGCDLSAWELKYSLDNDATRFAWADTANGRGVIYYMKDEWGNECPYDFKNIQFIPYQNDGTGTVYKYTFGSDEVDNSLRGGGRGNVIKEYWATRLTLNFIHFDAVCNNNTFGVDCYSNTFGSNCTDNTFGAGCYSNTFGGSCYRNTFGVYCTDNTFGSNCYSNSFGAYCYSNSFGDRCYRNTFGVHCYRNTFGVGCYNNSFGKYCYGNTFGGYCFNNVFGDGCRLNTFSDDCSRNSFGVGCSRNSFGVWCYGNTFGGNCGDNIFGSNCDSNSFGVYCSNNVFGSSTTTLSNYIRYNIFDNGCSYIKFYNISTASNTQQLQNVHVCSGVGGASGSYVEINTIARNLSYQTTVSRESDGTVKIWNDADTATLAQNAQPQVPTAVDGNLSEFLGGTTVDSGVATEAVVLKKPTAVVGNLSEFVLGGDIADSGIVAADVVTGVKGAVESAYRHGTVNITPANVGAIPLVGTPDATKLAQVTSDGKVANSGIVAVDVVTGVKGAVESAYRHGTVSITPANVGAIPSVVSAVVGDIPTLNAGGNLVDSGKKLSDYIPMVEKAVANGVATLDGGGKLLQVQLPDYIIAGMMYGGNVNGVGVCALSGGFVAKYGVSTLTLSVSNATLYEGVYFIATADGSGGVPQLLGVLVGDWVLSTGEVWSKIDNTDAVTGVKGAAESVYRIGDINITPANVGAVPLVTVTAVDDLATVGAGGVVTDSGISKSTLNTAISQAGNAQPKISSTGTNDMVATFTSGTTVSSGISKSTLNTAISQAGSAQPKISSTGTNDMVATFTSGTTVSSGISKSTLSTAISQAGNAIPKDSDAVEGNLSEFVSGGVIVDSGIAVADVVTGVKGAVESAYRHGTVNVTPANVGAIPLVGTPDATKLAQVTSDGKVANSGIVAVDVVTGVKGAVESVYRHGTVSITPANVGAVPLVSGGVVDDVATIGAGGVVTDSGVTKASVSTAITQAGNAIPKVTSAVVGDISEFGAGGVVVDSGISKATVATAITQAGNAIPKVPSAAVDDLATMGAGGVVVDSGISKSLVSTAITNATNAQPKISVTGTNDMVATFTKGTTVSSGISKSSVVTAITQAGNAIPKVPTAVVDDLATVGVGGVVTDSGISKSTLNTAISQAEDAIPKVSGAVVGNLSEFVTGGDIVDSGVTKLDLTNSVSITYSALVALRDGGNLVEGQLYRITDYTCTTTTTSTQSVGVLFDVIVRADSEGVLSEIAYATQHEGDTYFDGCNLSAWELKYCLDNDATRFAWADTEEGRGVVYYMKDEWGNECPYDFKNIRFIPYQASGTGTTYMYTFGSNTLDDSLHGGSYNNIINEYRASGVLSFNFIHLGSISKANIFDKICRNITLGDRAQGNTYGVSCYDIIFGDSCKFNHFGILCQHISGGNSCVSNDFKDSCSDIWFGNYYNGNFFNGNDRYIIFGSSTTSLTDYVCCCIFDIGCGYIKLYNTSTASQTQVLQGVHFGTAMYGSEADYLEFNTIPRGLQYVTMLAPDSDQYVCKWVEGDVMTRNGSEMDATAEAIDALNSRIAKLEGMLASLLSGDLVAAKITTQSLDVNGDTSLILRGAGVPTFPPYFVGQFYVNTTNGDYYKSTNNTAVSGWVLI